MSMETFDNLQFLGLLAVALVVGIFLGVWFFSRRT